MANLKLLFCVVTLALGSEGLRFGADPVTVETGILVVGRPTRLTCNYVKFRTESVREIVWFAGYNGINTKIFQYQVTAGTKEGSSFSFIKTDESTATDTELTITVPEYRTPILTIGCEVEVLRDSGYGKLKTAKKLEESNITVISSDRHQLILKSGADFGAALSSSEGFAAVGEPFQLKCMSAGVETPPNLTLHLNGAPWEQNHPGQMFENPLDVGTLFNGNTVIKSVTGRLSHVTDDMFSGYGKVMTVECFARYGEQVFDSKRMTVKKVDSLGQVSSFAGAGQGYSASPYSAPGPASSSGGSYSGGGAGNPYLRDPSRSGNPYQSEAESEDPYLAPEISGGRTERRPAYDPYRNAGQGFGHNERQGKVYNHDEIHSRLLDLVDPARHNHPGIPYDFYSGYILMISDSLDEQEQKYGSTSTAAVSTTTILGRLPDYVITSFQSNYGRYNQISNERYRLKMEPIEVLNLLGTFGYRVVDSTVSRTGKLIWTIEHRKFETEAAGSGGSFRGRDL